MSTTEEQIEKLEIARKGLDDIIDSMERVLDMLSPGGALYNCGEEYLRNAMLLYFSNLLGKNKA